MNSEQVDFSDWGRAFKLVREGNVKLHDPGNTHSIFKVIGESDSYTIGVDMDSREVGGCMCGDKTYNSVKTCYHEIAVHIALAVLDDDVDDEIKNAILETPKLNVRKERTY